MSSTCTLGRASAKRVRWIGALAWVAAGRELSCVSWAMLLLYGPVPAAGAPVGIIPHPAPVDNAARARYCSAMSQPVSGAARPLIILNPGANRGRTSSLAATLTGLAHELGSDAEVVETTTAA